MKNVQDKRVETKEVQYNEVVVGVMVENML